MSDTAATDASANVDFGTEIASLQEMQQANAAFQIAFQEAQMEMNADNKVSQLASSAGK